MSARHLLASAGYLDEPKAAGHAPEVLARLAAQRCSICQGPAVPGLTVCATCDEEAS